MHFMEVTSLKSSLNLSFSIPPYRWFIKPLKT